jgi:hypothetical protein
MEGVLGCLTLNAFSTHLPDKTKPRNDNDDFDNADDDDDVGLHGAALVF